jgi:hypothetical protein
MVAKAPQIERKYSITPRGRKKRPINGVGLGQPEHIESFTPEERCTLPELNHSISVVGNLPDSA